MTKSLEIIKNYQNTRKAFKGHRLAHKAIFELDKALFNEYIFAKECLLRYEEYIENNDGDTLPVVLYVKNKTNKEHMVEIFGAALNQRKSNFGNPQGIEITTLSNITYHQILSSTFAKDIDCAYIRLSATGEKKQVTESWEIESVSLEGLSVCTPIPNMASFSPYQVQEGMLDLTYPIKIDALTKIRFKMLKNTTMAIYLFPKKPVSKGEAQDTTGGSFYRVGIQAPQIEDQVDKYKALYESTVESLKRTTETIKELKNSKEELKTTSISSWAQEDHKPETRIIRVNNETDFKKAIDTTIGKKADILYETKKEDNGNNKSESKTNNVHKSNGVSNVTKVKNTDFITPTTKTSTKKKKK